ncbi:MAG: hypothetical protein HY258_04480, partial [Chloroflexi bacterium]|nr:hypothetical protein [Chloroflexota bacterium]
NNGACVPVDPNKPFGLCPSGSHYDNTLQNCADDVTNQLASPCPPGYPYYIPADRLCLAKAYPIVYDCQAFTLQLGDCSLQQKKPEAGGSKSCSSYGDQTSCEAHPCRWISGACQTP